ncbi:hypothetical protein GUJ93_ZPchr0445g33601 [Zizania palustris]|uniref:Uncharacterized protein n=1 Tax=Zizania palustris TaxID=103762 RepID=A0A8J5V2B2_ZIZPA|nr:hypothetical protein GUJ93_ZPchr0445g33601 [Zizania palustris]
MSVLLYKGPYLNIGLTFDAKLEEFESIRSLMAQLANPKYAQLRAGAPPRAVCDDVAGAGDRGNRLVRRTRGCAKAGQQPDVAFEYTRNELGFADLRHLYHAWLQYLATMGFAIAKLSTAA